MIRLTQTKRKENPVTKLSSLSITLAATGLLLISAGCQSLPTGTNLVSVVKNGTIEAYPSVPIGRAFEATFDNPQWRSAESEKGVKFVEFNGRLKSSKHKEVFDAALSEYHKCASQVDEVHRMPNYSFLKHLADKFYPGYEGGIAFGMAQANKGNEARIAELYNSNSNPDAPTDSFKWELVLQDAGKIGAGNPKFDRFVKEEGDIKKCGPGTEEELAAVRFQFEFTPDAKSFSMTYIDLEPWKRINLSAREDVLQYVFR